jgi:protein SCO1
MRIRNIILGVGLVAGLALFASCGGEHKGAESHSTHDHTAEYQCPMKCEGEKTYDSNVTCPVCKMDLKEVETVD